MGTEHTARNVSKQFIPALAVIDMQNDFVSGSLAVPDASSIIDKINSIIELPFQIRIASQDFHPDNHVSFAATHNKSTFETATIYHPDDTSQMIGIQQTLWPIHCIANTEGSDFVPGLTTNKFDKVVHKGTHARIESYSAFKDIWGKSETELPSFLSTNNITDVFFVGLASDYCVKYTALHSVDYGYETWVVKDAVRSISTDNAAWEEMEKKGIHIITEKDLVALLVKDSNTAK